MISPADTRPAERRTPVPPVVIEPPAFDPVALAERVAAAVSAHPAVARLHGGLFGDVATYLPGRRLIGVRISESGAPVELGVVLHLNRPIPDVVRSLRRQVSLLCGGAAVDIVVADVVEPDVARPTVVELDVPWTGTGGERARAIGVPRLRPRAPPRPRW
jgi:hypothetical protein